MIRHGTWPAKRLSPDSLHISSGYTEAFDFAFPYGIFRVCFCPCHVMLVEYCGIDLSLMAYSFLSLMRKKAGGRGMSWSCRLIDSVTKFLVEDVDVQSSSELQFC